MEQGRIYKQTQKLRLSISGQIGGRLFSNPLVQNLFLSLKTLQKSAFNAKNICI